MGGEGGRKRGGVWASRIAATRSRRCATTPPAPTYRTETDSTWRPRRGSHVSQTGKLTAAAIDARDFLRAREHRTNEAHLPDGTLVAVAGGKEAGNVNAICTALDRVKERHPNMVLVHGGGPGAERVASRWAENNEVHEGAHYLILRERPETLEVVEIFHERMNIEAHLEQLMQDYPS